MGPDWQALPCGPGTRAISIRPALSHQDPTGLHGTQKDGIAPGPLAAGRRWIVKPVPSKAVLSVTITRGSSEAQWIPFDAQRCTLDCCYHAEPQTLPDSHR